jgi:hypothetical protein
MQNNVLSGSAESYGPGGVLDNSGVRHTEKLCEVNRVEYPLTNAPHAVVHVRHSAVVSREVPWDQIVLCRGEGFKDDGADDVWMVRLELSPAQDFRGVFEEQGCRCKRHEVVMDVRIQMAMTEFTQDMERTFLTKVL